MNLDWPGEEEGHRGRGREMEGGREAEERRGEEH